jgi:hypothetical protein
MLLTQNERGCFSESFQLFGKDEVAELPNEVKPKGNYLVTFNASQLTSGVYFYKISAGSFNQTKKMILVK